MEQYITRLDSNLQDKIYNYYWQRVYFNAVVEHLKTIKIEIYRFILFMRRHVFCQVTHHNFKRHNSELLRYNRIFTRVSKDKGIILYLKKEFSFFNYLYSTDIEYRDIHEDYKYVGIYSICCSNQLRYYVYDIFKSIHL